MKEISENREEKLKMQGAIFTMETKPKTFANNKFVWA